MQISRNTSLAPHTTFKIGGPAAYFVAPTSVEELREALHFAKEKSLPVLVLGGGSNVLIDDEGFDGLVIQNKITGVVLKEESNEVLVVSGAGENWDQLVACTVKNGLYGLENLSGIPGSVGATPIQNVGAYGAEVADTIEWVEVFDIEEDTIKYVGKNACVFGYRDSMFKTPEGKKYIVTRVCFRLSRVPRIKIVYKDLAKFFEGKGRPSLAEVRDAVLEVRSKKFPDLKEYGTAGSFFKMPIVSRKQADALQKQYPDIPLYPVDDQKTKVVIAWVLDHVLHMRGFTMKNVSVHKNHSLVLVSVHNATSNEVKELAQHITNLVKQKTNITLEPEVTFVKNKK